MSLLRMTDFSSKVISFIKKIPKGKVATYGQIATLAGNSQSSRGVSWILSSSSKAHHLPWHRVIGSAGKISFPRLSSAYARQRRLLLQEGVVFTATDLVDLKIYGWRPKSRASKS